MEIVLPGSESVHSARWIHELVTDNEHPRTSLLVPNAERVERTAQLITDIKSELGLEGLTAWVDEASHDYELLAPEGYEFVMRGRFYVNCQDGTSGLMYTGIPSEEAAIEERKAQGTYCEEYDDSHEGLPYGSEFRGTRICLGVDYNNANPYKAKAEPWRYHDIYRRSDSDKPRVEIIVKAPLDVYMTSHYGIEVPFDLEGRPKNMYVPMNSIAYRDTYAEGMHHSVTVSLEPIAPVEPDPQLVLPERDFMADRTEEMWLPEPTMKQTFEEVEQEPHSLIDYMIHRLGSKQAVYDYHRRNYGTPFKDDPLWRAKDLVVIESDDIEKELTYAIPRIADGSVKDLARRLFESVVGTTIQIDEIKKKETADLF